MRPWRNGMLTHTTMPASKRRSKRYQLLSRGWLDGSADRVELGPPSEVATAPPPGISGLTGDLPPSGEGSFRTLFGFFIHSGCEKPRAGRARRETFGRGGRLQSVHHDLHSAIRFFAHSPVERAWCNAVRRFTWHNCRLRDVLFPISGLLARRSLASALAHANTKVVAAAFWAGVPGASAFEFKGHGEIWTLNFPVPPL